MVSLLKFCVDMYLDNRKKIIKFQGHKSKVKVTGPDFQMLYHGNIELCCYYNSTVARQAQLGR